METVSIITDLVLIGLLIIYIIRDLRTTTKAKRNKINIYFSRRNTPEPPDPKVSLKDANELAGKSAAKDAERIARLEKEVDTRAMLIAKLTNNKIVNTNTINRLTAENDELTARVRELEGKPKLNNKPVKTTSKNATSGK